MHDVTIISETALEQVLELDRLSGGGLFARVVDIYLAETPTILRDLRSAIDAGDPDRAAVAAHALKSASMNVGAQGVATVCTELEALGRRGSVDGAESLALQLDEAYPLVKAALERRVLKHTAEAFGG
jgi:HPt (histidine-containing phosphotransfer) domain-containing protein